MEKWKELGKRKKFWVCVGVLVAIGRGRLGVLAGGHRHL